MSTIELNKDNFDQTLADNDMVVVDFWAPWCGPCRFFAPVFEDASEKNAGVVFGKVNTDEQPELAGMFGIRSIPTLMIVRDKVVLYQEAGSMPAGPFQELLDKARALDMAEVHRAIAEEKAKSQA
jgi:thioredoxin 1